MNFANGANRIPPPSGDRTTSYPGYDLISKSQKARPRSRTAGNAIHWLPNGMPMSCESSSSGAWNRSKDNQAALGTEKDDPRDCEKVCLKGNQAVNKFTNALICKVGLRGKPISTKGTPWRDDRPLRSQCHWPDGQILTQFACI
jgi:hypothetical protein